MHLRFVLAVILATVGCSTVRALRPLAPGELAVGGSVGGPLVRNLGPPLPLPLPSVGARLGLGHKMDVDAFVHLPVGRPAGLTLGGDWLVLKQEHLRPAVMLDAHVSLFAPMQAGRGQTLPRFGWQRPGFAVRAYPELGVHASWLAGQRTMLFLGGDASVDGWAGSVIPSARAGLRWLGPGAWQWTAELGWLAFTSNSRDLPILWAGVYGYGALAAHFGLTYTFFRPQPVPVPDCVPFARP